MPTSLLYLPDVDTHAAVDQGGADLRGDPYEKVLRKVQGGAISPTSWGPTR